MSGLRSTGRVGSTSIPNWRWEDPDLDPYELRIAGWLASNTQGYTDEYVSRNLIAKRTGISASKVSKSVTRLAELGIIDYYVIAIRQAEGGQRWVITIHLDVWQLPRSPETATLVVSDANPGRAATATTGISEEVENRETAKPSPVGDGAFEKFWLAYPKHMRREKKNARQAWHNTLRRPDCDLDLLRVGFKAWNTYWQANDHLQCPYPAKWLKNDRWHPDELPTDKPQATPREAINERPDWKDMTPKQQNMWSGIPGVDPDA